MWMINIVECWLLLGVVYNSSILSFLQLDHLFTEELIYTLNKKKKLLNAKPLDLATNMWNIYVYEEWKKNRCLLFGLWNLVIAGFHGIYHVLLRKQKTIHILVVGFKIAGKPWVEFFQICFNQLLICLDNTIMKTLGDSKL